jgi:hypothetical protein
MTPEQLIASIRESLAQYEAELAPQFVTADPSTLQALLDTAEVPIHLAPGQEYPGVVIARSVTLIGHGASIKGDAKPAIRVAPGTAGVYIEDVACTAVNWRDAVVQLGDNSSTTQGSVDLVPRDIVLAAVRIPSHRGKAGFAVHATQVALEDCEVKDLWDPGLSDSKAIWIHNTPGSVEVLGGYFEAGSENLLVGGDSVKIPGNTPTGILIEGAVFEKPAAWQTDGVNRAVKNLLELKAGRNVTIRDCTFRRNWVAAQTGWGLVITPKNANIIDGVLIENCTIEQVAGGLNLLGLDYNTVTPAATRNIVVRRCSFAISKATQGGGYGILALMTGGMKDVTFDQCTASFDGPEIILSDTNATYGPQGPVTITGCTMNTGQYALKGDGASYGDALPAGSPYIGQELLIGAITGNTFSGAPSRFKANFPSNIYL